MSDSTPEQRLGWVVLELMGHRRLAGYLTEVQIGGVTFLRLDVPSATHLDRPGGATQYYSPSAVYCITPTTEATAREVAGMCDLAPVARWALPPAPVSDSDDHPF